MKFWWKSTYFDRKSDVIQQCVSKMAIFVSTGDTSMVWFAKETGLRWKEN